MVQHPPEWLQQKSLTIPNADKEAEKRNTVNTTGRRWAETAQLDGQVTATVGIHSRETKTRLEGDGLTGVHSDVIHSNNNKTQMTDSQ